MANGNYVTNSKIPMGKQDLHITMGTKDIATSFPRGKQRIAKRRNSYLKKNLLFSVKNSVKPVCKRWYEGTHVRVEAIYLDMQVRHKSVNRNAKNGKDFTCERSVFCKD